MKYGHKLWATVSLSVLMALPVTPAAAQLDELIVTVRKREENIQKVPLSVSAFSGSALADENITNIEDLSALVAGFEFDRSFQRGFERPVIRGKSSILSGSEPGVSFFIDGVFFNGTIASIDLSSVERVEIVKGPQSALYGRNTYSGAVNVVTKKPGDELDITASVSAAEHDQYELTAGISGPLVEDILSGGLYVRHYEYGGEYRNQQDGELYGVEETDSISGVLNYTPNESWEATLRGWWQQDDDGPIAVSDSGVFDNNFALNTAPSAGEPFNIYFKGELPNNDTVNYDNVLPALFGDVGRETERVGGSLKLSWDVTDSLKITSITGYEELDIFFNQSATYHPNGSYVPIFVVGGIPDPRPAAGMAPNTGLHGALLNPVLISQDKTVETFNQDLRFEHDNGGRFRFLGGVSYYSFEDTEAGLRDDAALAANAALLDELKDKAMANLVTNQCEASPLCDPSIATIDDLNPIILTSFESSIPGPEDLIVAETENIGIYGRVEFDVTERVTFGAEARYSEEEVKARLINDGVVIFEDEKVNYSFTPRFTLDYELSDENLLYGVIANGTKPGGFNTDDGGPATGRTSFDEEEIWSFEVGSKNTFADGQLRFNIAGYIEEITGYQLTEGVVFIDPETDAPATDSLVTNKGTVELKGFEIETIFQPNAVEGLSLNLNYAYNDNEFTEGTDDNLGLVNELLDDGLFNCSTGDLTPEDACLGEDDTINASIVGNRTPLSAEHQLSVGIDYSRPIANGNADWFIGTTASYESSKFVQVLNLAEISPSTVVNFSTGIENDTFRFSVWGRNIFDEDALQSATRHFDGNDTFKRAFLGTPRRGSQWGVTLSADF